MNCNFARVILVMVFVGLANLAFCQVEKGLTEGMKNISKLGSGISKSGLREMTSGTTPFLALSQGIKIDGEIMKATSITTSSPSVFFNEKPPQIMPEGLSFDFSPINSRELQASVKREPVSTSLLNQEKTLRSEHAFLWGKYGDASLIHAARE